MNKFKSRTRRLIAASMSLFVVGQTTLAQAQVLAIKIPPKMLAKSSQEQPGELSVSPSPAVFTEGVVLGTSSAPLVLTVTNKGAGAVSNVVPGIPSGTGEFSQESTCGETLPSNASCSISLTFKPTIAGERSGTVSVSSSASNGLQLVPISGTGMAPEASLTAGNFAATQIGQTSSSTLVLANTSPTALALTPSALTGDFALAGGNCGSSLAAGANCTYAVDFKPTSAGAKTASFKVTLGVGSYSFERSVTLQAQAQAPSGTLTAIDFGIIRAGLVATRDATLTNTGSGPLLLGAPFASGSGFSIVSGGSCGATLSKDNSCTVKVQFQPSGTSTYTGTLTVPVQDAAALTASLSGQSAESKAVLASPAAVNLAGWYSVGTTTNSFTYRNIGSGPMTLASPALVSPLSVSRNTCTAVAPGAYCDITVALTRNGNTGGSGSQSFTASGAGESPPAVTVNWSIYSVIPNWSSSTLAFGSIETGQSSTKSITLTNNGSVAANWAANNTLTNLPADFTADLSACSNVAPGGSCQVNFSFSPTADQPYGGGGVAPSYATIAGNSLTLSGTGAITGLVSRAKLTSSNLISLYGWYGSGTQTGIFTYRNVGNIPMTLSSPSLSAPLSVASNSCSSVAPGGSCSITVALTLNAHAGGSSSQSFTASGANSNPAEVIAYWTIYSTAPQWSTTSLDFGTVQIGQTSTKDITLYNYGSSSVNWSSNSSIANLPSGFSFNLSACSNVAPNGGSCNVRVTFSPGAAGSYGGGSIYPAHSSYVKNTLLVAGATPAVGTFSYISASNLQFGVSGKAGHVTIQNTGTVTITGISAAFVKGSCNITTPPASSLAPGEQTTVAFHKATISSCDVSFTGTNASNSPLVIKG